ncbi:CoA transferase, partial [Escherichia coli]|nr:CoA transferase [Escherichia coli]
ERFVSNSLRAKNRVDLTELITQAFATLTIEDVVDRLERAQIANARMNEMRDVWSHPQLKARERWRSIQSPVGVIPALLPPG